jgi:hypothetical protein
MAANSICRITLRPLLAPKVSNWMLSARPTNGIATNSRARFLSSSVLRDHDVDGEIDYRMPVTRFTEDEVMVRDAARAWANQELKPLVREMDDECTTRSQVIQGLFDHGFMGMVGFRLSHHFLQDFCLDTRGLLILFPPYTFTGNSRRMGWFRNELYISLSCR